MDINREKKEAITALLASAFTHFKKIATAEPGDAMFLPPTPEESKREYQNDPVVNRCVDACLYGVIEILGSDNPTGPRDKPLIRGDGRIVQLNIMQMERYRCSIAINAVGFTTTEMGAHGKWYVQADPSQCQTERSLVAKHVLKNTDRLSRNTA